MLKYYDLIEQLIWFGDLFDWRDWMIVGWLDFSYILGTRGCLYCRSQY
jgi:hypothetical protein